MHPTRPYVEGSPRKRAAERHLAIFQEWCKLGRPSVYRFARLTKTNESVAREAIEHHRSLEMLREE